jgi:hypothetical protein
METNLANLTGHLSRHAPWWLFSLGIAVLFSPALVARLVYFAEGGPDRDSLLARYAQAEHMVSPGDRCTELTLTVPYLSPEDMGSGGYSKWEKARQENGRCIVALEASNKRFDTLRDAVRFAQLDRMSIERETKALHALSAFDRSRTRFGEQATEVAKVEADKKGIGASDRDLAALAAQASAFDRSGSAADALAVSQAMNTLSDLDRLRLGNQENRQVRASIDAADKLVFDARTKLGRVSAAARKVGYAQTPETERELFASVAAVTPFDEGIAPPRDRAMLAHALEAAVGIACEVLRDELADYGAGSLVNGDDLVVPYHFLKSRPDLSADQRALLAQASTSAQRMMASDSRLAALNPASKAWSQQGPAAEQQVSKAVAAITSLDRSRFDSGQQESWKILLRAQAVLDGPKLGLTPSTRDRLPIYVMRVNGSADTSDSANVLSEALERAGFQVAMSLEDAALITTIGVDSVDASAPHTSGEFMEYVCRVRLNVQASWRASDQLLFSAEIERAGEARDQAAARKRALANGVHAIVRRLAKADERAE